MSYNEHVHKRTYYNVSRPITISNEQYEAYEHVRARYEYLRTRARALGIRWPEDNNQGLNVD